MPLLLPVDPRCVPVERFEGADGVHSARQRTFRLGALPLETLEHWPQSALEEGFRKIQHGYPDACVQDEI